MPFKLTQKWKSRLMETVFFLLLFSLVFIIYHKYYQQDYLYSYGDVVQYFSMRLHATDALISGEVPLWNKYLENGIPFAADLNLMYYPFAILFSFLPLKLFAYSFYGFHLALGGFYTYKYLTEIKCNKAVSYFVGFVYALSINLHGFRKGHIVIIAAVVYLPVILYCAERFLNKKTNRDLIFLIVALSLCALTCFLQGVVYIYIFVFVYSVISMIVRKFTVKEACRAFSIAGVGVLGIIAVQYLPSLQILSEYSKYGSNAVSFDYFKSFSIHPVKLIQMIFPHFFGNEILQTFGPSYSSEMDIEVFIGISALSVAIFAFWKLRKDYLTKILLSGAILTLFYSACAHIPYLAQIIYRIPVIGGLRSTSRALFVFIFCMLVMFARGLNYIVENCEVKSYLSFLRFYSSGILLLSAIVYSAIFAVNAVAPSLYSITDISTYTARAFYKPCFVAVCILLLTCLLNVVASKYFVRSNKNHLGLYVAFALVICLISIAEISPFVNDISPAPVSDMEIANDPAVKAIRDNLGDDKVWTAIQGSESGFDNLLSLNRNVIVDIPQINAYVHFNNPMLVRLMSKTDSVQFNGSGTLIGNHNAADIVQYDNNLLSMLGVKYIIDADNYINDEDGIFVKRVLQVKGAGIPQAIDSNPSVQEFNIDLSPHTTYKVQTNIWCEKSGSMVLEFFGGDGYNNEEQRMALDFGEGPTNKYFYINSGDISNAKDICLRATAYSKDTSIAMDLTVDEVNLQEYAETYKPFYRDESTAIYENTKAKDILFVPQEIQPISNEDDIFNDYYTRNIAKNAYIVDAQPMNFNPESVIISDVNFRTNDISAIVNAAEDTFICFSQNQFAGWNAYVDGKRVENYTVNALIQGAFVPAGIHVVEFKFQPILIYVTALISLFTICILAGWFVYEKRKDARNNAHSI